MIRTALVLALIVFTAGARPLAAQDDVAFNSQAESMFLLGVRQFVQQEYKSAYQTFKQTAEVQPLHQRTTAAIVMEAKAANALTQYADAVSLCTELLERFPFSSYAEDAHYTMGVAYRGMMQNRAAAEEMIAVLNIGQMRATRWRALEHLEALALQCTAGELRSLQSQAVDDTARVQLLLLRGEAYARSGMHDSAAVVAGNIAARTVDKKILRRAQRLIPHAAPAGAADTLTVGVLLPFMNHLKIETRERITSEEIARGIREALRDYREDAASIRTAIRLDVRDSQRQKEQIERIIGEWRTDSTVVAILGPLFSDEMIAAAAKVNEARIPLLSPTANGNNIASLGEFVFQANPDYTMRGTLMAQYAVRTVGILNLAVLTTNEPPGSLLTEAFTAEARRLGANVFSVQRYSSGVSDFRHLFRAMKSDAAASKNGALQAIYCPIASAADIGVVTSQLRVFDPNIMVLGTDEWNDDEELDRNKASADGVIFPSDRWDTVDAGPVSGLSFESFGYDAASLLLRCLTGARDTRESLQHRLSLVREYDGIHSKISFTEHRVNSFLHILQYKNGFIKKIADINYQP